MSSADDYLRQQQLARQYAQAQSQHGRQSGSPKQPFKTPINKSWLYKSMYLYEVSFITKREFDSIQEMLNSDDPDSQGLGSGLIDIKMRELREDIQAFKEIKKGQTEE